ncbi:MAG: ThiF family adenylyltransferase [Puia sp.]|nr:ThiF family adenylyltransferase [Puia sp.]
MRYTITFLEREYRWLTQHLFDGSNREKAAYALCRIAASGEENRLLVRKIIPVTAEDTLDSSEVHMKIRSISFIRAMKEANDSKQLFVFIHSHPRGFLRHSEKDDAEESELFRTAYLRIRTQGLHGSVVLSSPDHPVGRVWMENGTHAEMDLVRVIGDRFKFHFSSAGSEPVPEFFDRQVRAFGEDVQRLLQRLHVAVVGAGGTGSAVIEQLIRLGVGKLTIIDGERLEKSNVNRVYGSGTDDEGMEKIEIARRSAARIGLSTRMEIVNSPISYRFSASRLKTADFIFGCTDDQLGRSILSNMAIYYGIPVLDMGVRIDSQEGVIRSIEGRVTTLLPEKPCLYCWGKITPKGVLRDSLAQTDPQQLQELIRQGYADELETPAPAVIPFTSAIASFAVMELLNRLTGFMEGDEPEQEVWFRFDWSVIKRRNHEPDERCRCGNSYFILRGDADPFLDLTWRNESNEKKKV